MKKASMWLLLAVAGGLAFLYMLYKKQSKSAPATSPATNVATTGATSPPKPPASPPPPPQDKTAQQIAAAGTLIASVGGALSGLGLDFS